MSPDNPPLVRVYTCLIDGEARSVTFPHNGWTGPLLNLETTLRFREWLDQVAPGSRGTGRVTDIRFEDVAA